MKYLKLSVGLGALIQVLFGFGACDFKRDYCAQVDNATQGQPFWADPLSESTIIRDQARANIETSGKYECSELAIPEEKKQCLAVLDMANEMIMLAHEKRVANFIAVSQHCPRHR